MPNWCSNTLTVHGTVEDVMKFFEENRGIETGPEFGMADGDTRELPLSFKASHPTPDQSKFTDHSYQATQGEPDYWHNWNVKNWGTKWDLGDETYVTHSNHNDNKRTLEYSFETAWAPPTEWLTHVAALYTTLSFKLSYSEEGMGFSGILGFHNGREVENQYWEGTVGMDIEQYDEMYGEDT